ncbi:hypothetical protein M2341_003072 [Sphingobium sp. B7D2B]|uniref:BLUF domain-containing protein n=1 Tax=Sphingobium sp. B7D2B TaxID=2940583 RepID=UPI002225A9F9|nr:BLUF domain-containing protein [Sphingobium sp. B7D2B]MCW2367625.1 hypothetical protein [Sphingobium sp. B7D2B]
MHRFLYISTVRRTLSDAELEDILVASRRNNRLADVTGLLVVGNRRFLQVLEGPEDAVNSTFSRISKDQRHYAVVQLNNKAIAARSFARWEMGFQRGGDVNEGSTLEEQVASLLEPVADANLKAYFSGFAKSHSQPAGETTNMRH